MGGEAAEEGEKQLQLWRGVTHKVEGRVKGNSDREPPSSLTR